MCEIALCSSNYTEWKLSSYGFCGSAAFSLQNRKTHTIHTMSSIGASHPCTIHREFNSSLADDWLLWRTHPEVNTKVKVAVHGCCVELRGGGEKREGPPRRKEERGKERRKQKDRSGVEKDGKIWKAACAVWFWFQLSVSCHLGESVSHELMYNSPHSSPWLPLLSLFLHHSIIFPLISCSYSPITLLPNSYLISFNCFLTTSSFLVLASFLLSYALLL